jgi:hypothetical protein
MNEPNDNANAASSRASVLRSSSIILAFMTPRLRSLLRAIEFCCEERWNLELLDVERVEAVWEMVDAVSISHGFVLALRDGQRAYLQYVSDDEAEDVQLLPMANERYPALRGGRFIWTDDVGDMNRFLNA